MLCSMRFLVDSLVMMPSDRADSDVMVVVGKPSLLWGEDCLEEEEG